jgi:hypothetical protein
MRLLQNGLLLLALVIFSGAVRAQQLGVYPTQLDYNLTAGQSESKAITLTNGSTNKVQFRFYLNDWLRDTAGGHIYYRADTLSRSCAKWVTLGKNFVELEPGQTAQVTVKLTVPESPEAIKQMKWAMLFVETVEEQNNAVKKNGANINNLLRIGVHIYQTPPNLTTKKVKVLELSPVPKTVNNYRLTCKNEGDVMLECKSYVELASLADGKKIKTDPIEFPLFPEQKRYVNFQLPANLPKGKYSALAVVDAGEDISLEAVESTIEIK